MNAMMTIELVNGRPISHENTGLRMGWERVYFALAPSAGMVKIGTTYRLPLRLAELQLMSPVPVELIGHVAGGVERERAYHEMFVAQRHHGEWFRYTHAVADKIGLDCLIDAWNAMRPRNRERFLGVIEIVR